MSDAVFAFPAPRVLVTGVDEILHQARTLFPGSGRDPGTGPIDQRYSIERGERAWRLLGDGARLAESGDPVRLLLALEFEIERAWTRSCRGRLALHAGTVAVGEKACLVAGRPGAGKSATAFQLLELGHGFLGEEVSVVDTARGEVRPFLRSLALDPGYLEAWAAGRPIRRGEVRLLDPGRSRYLPRRRVAEPRPVDTLLLPRYRPEGPTSVAELAPEAALPEVLGHCYEPADGEEAQFDRAIELVERVRILRLAYGGAEEARSRLLELFGEAAT